MVTDYDEFGFLPIDLSLNLTVGNISTLPNLELVVEHFYKMANPDKYIYPPISYQTRKVKSGKFRKIPFSERAVSLYRIPVTHAIKLRSALDQAEARRNISGFLIHFLGFLFGYRCQFKDWSIDGRIRTSSDGEHPIPRLKLTESLIQHALDSWQRFPARQRIVATNILYLHQRASNISFEWERLQAEYQVCDAIFALARDTKQLQSQGRIGHADQLNCLCDLYSIPKNTDIVSKAVRLRNDIIHEALWDGGMPGEARSPESGYISIWLHNLTRRLIFAIFGFQGNFISSKWWFLGQFAFDVRPAG